MNEQIFHQSECLSKGPLPSLEKRFIEEYLLDKGYRLEDLRELPEARAKHLMKGACKYASLKLALVEARSRFLERIHLSS